MQDRICCLITTKARQDDLLIERGSFENGKLPFKSFIRPYRIFTINKNIIDKRLCTINNDFYDKIIKEVNKYLKRI